jgi:hypothetical protein
LAAATLDGSNSVVMSRPPPLSRSGCQMQRRKTEGGAELDDGLGPHRARQHVQQTTGVAGHRQRIVLQLGIELAIVRLAAHQPLLLVLGDRGEDRVGKRGMSLGLKKEAVEQGRHRGADERGHDVSPMIERRGYCSTGKIRIIRRLSYSH